MKGLALFVKTFSKLILVLFVVTLLITIIIIIIIVISLGWHSNYKRVLLLLFNEIIVIYSRLILLFREKYYCRLFFLL
jgi:hypothetical protein